ncbi:Periplasmic thiol:disulfide interchange protein DsbA [Labilithrix luteola]|uniref:peptidylprolyl isomerase n=1 Tax=Labilithrix luteola TaxID=1391654 RepID=A0A0K1PRP4_9BACT|nr:thioredoxin domain-containing protein [Labilithrix luteola]AKU95784.1 Periplasmic thiol:disulfide interchange protein DsbA [Labilithrix luteola]
MKSFARNTSIVATLTSLVVLANACGGAASTPATPAADANAKAAVGKVEAPAAEDDLVVPIFKDDATRGKRDALVTIVMFSDFQCPFCSRVEVTLDKVRETYGDDVRIVWKHEPLPFHQHAKIAAVIGEGLRAMKGDEAFWRYHDLVFRRQKDMSPESLRAWAVASGADAQELEQGLEKKTWEKKVERDVELAKTIGATGTPSFRINGLEFSGAQPFENFKAVIDGELAKAKSLVAEGVARDKVYRVLVAENFKKHVEEEDDEDEKEDVATVWKVPVAGSPVRGKADAPVTIVEFSDFQCPYCKKVGPTLDEIRKTYGDKVRIVWKDMPLSFHPRAMPAAEVARAARAAKGDAGFWDVHDKLFASQPKLEDADLEAVAKSAGLDVAKVMGAVKGQTYKKGIEADMLVGDDIQASGTPHFFINGRRLVGAQPLAKFKTIIDEELKKFDDQKGKVAAKDYYDSLMKTAKGAPEPERKIAAPPPANAPFMGAANGKVLIQQWSDFQCPFCSRVEGTIDELVKAYPTQVKVVWRDKPLPMHPDAPLAAEAAREAYAQKGNAGFAKMRKLMFDHQREDGLKRPALEGYAKEIGLDVAKFNAALDNHVHKAAIDADEKAGTDIGVNGTPSFVVGPYYISGAQPLTKFKRAVELALNPPPAPKAGVTDAKSGLVVQDVTVGKGREVKAGDKITVHYVGTLPDGTEFDSSRKRNQPFDFSIGNGMVIKGWEQGLIGMKVGGRRKLTIPPELGYGDRGAPPVIPPKATLLFDVELVSIQ